jgi:DNA-binding LytR/AlgR family response regulator
MNCLIVEDEPLAVRVLEEFIRKIPMLNLVGHCPDAHHAVEAMREQPVDVLFLDIHLPGLKGLDFLKSLPVPPQTIVTTAYPDYALEGFDLGVTDYLHKPFDFERFAKAISRLKPLAVAAPTRAFRFFNVNKKMVRVWLDDIVAIEGLKEYVRLYLADGHRIVTKGQLHDFERTLQPQGIRRAHKSYLVAMPHLTAYSAHEAFIGTLAIPIGRQYKAVFFEGLDHSNATT